MILVCRSCGIEVDPDASRCTQCGTAMEDGAPPEEPGWRESATAFWVEHYWDGSAWSEAREMEPDHVASGLVGSVFLYPSGVIWGQISARKLRRSTMTEVLEDEPAARASEYGDISAIQFRRPSALVQGKLHIELIDDLSSKVARIVPDVIFDKRQVDALQAIHEVLDERWRACRGRQRAEPAAEGPSGVAPGWYPDGTDRHELRFFDGSGWTRFVADGWQHGIDPIGR